MIICTTSFEKPGQNHDQPSRKIENPIEFDPDFWDAFLPDDELEIEPLPELGDFWIDPDMENLCSDAISEQAQPHMEDLSC